MGTPRWDARPENKAKIAALGREWRKKPENKVKQKVATKRWRAANRERVIETRNRWLAKRRETDKSYGRGRHSIVIKHLLMQRDKSICQICGEPVAFADASLDHIIPISRGGSDEATNIRLAHLFCNVSRGNKY